MHDGHSDACIPLPGLWGPSHDPPSSCGAAAATSEWHKRPFSPSQCGPGPGGPSPPGPVGWPFPGSAWAATSPGRRRPSRDEGRLRWPPPHPHARRLLSPPGTCRSRGSSPMCSKPSTSGSAMLERCSDSAHARLKERATGGRVKATTNQRRRTHHPPGSAGALASGLSVGLGGCGCAEELGLRAEAARGRRVGCGTASPIPFPDAASQRHAGLGLPAAELRGRGGGSSVPASATNPGRTARTQLRAYSFTSLSASLSSSAFIIMPKLAVGSAGP